MNYGITFQGSKNTIAEDIIKLLPSGKRLVDLFGGGFAISHCALLSGKWEEVYYNDIDPLLPELIQKAINGEYNYKNFTPEFIDREIFHNLKLTDGYVKYIWSFGTDGDTYMYGKDIEEYKKGIHNLIVFGNDSEVLDGLLNIKGKEEIEKHFNRGIIEHTPTIKQKRLFVIKLFNEKISNTKTPQQLEHIHQLERLQNLHQLERLQNLQLNSHDYKEYQYKKGDIVYCDIPYENTRGYQGNIFNHNEFYKWVRTRQYPVWFSSYEISEEFPVIFEIEKVSLMESQTRTTMIEKIYCNDLALDYTPIPNYPTQISLFDI